jgi:hypothetical protein
MPIAVPIKGACSLLGSSNQAPVELLILQCN